MTNEPSLSKYYLERIKSFKLNEKKVIELSQKYRVCPICEDYNWSDSPELVIEHLTFYPETCLKGVL